MTKLAPEWIRTSDPVIRSLARYRWTMAPDLRSVNSKPGSESPWSLPGCATVRALLSAEPSSASDWVGFEDLYHTPRGITDLCNSRGPGGGRVITVWTAESSVQILGV